MNDSRGQNGFTLLEVIVALAILGIVAGAAAGVYSAITGAGKSVEEVGLLTNAARSKLVELEAEVKSTGTLNETSGDFGEGLKGWTWEAETEGISPSNSIALVKLTLRLIGEGRGVNRATAQATSGSSDGKTYTLLVKPGSS